MVKYENSAHDHLIPTDNMKLLFIFNGLFEKFDFIDADNNSLHLNQTAGSGTNPSLYFTRF
jgi:hypothetical protein